MHHPTRVALCDQLRAHLRVVSPAVVELFADLDSPISLPFLTRFPSVDEAAWLSHERLGAWPAANGHCGRKPTRVLLDHLQAAPDGLTGDAAAAAAHTTSADVNGLGGIREQISVLDAQVREQLALHPDANILTSLPRGGRLRVARLRDAVIDFAGDSRRASPRAAAIYDRDTAAGKTHQHATRILARAWLRVIWRCWQDGTAYDPASHRGPRPFLTQDAERRQTA